MKERLLHWFTIRLLNLLFSKNYEGIDKVAIEAWLEELWAIKGFQSYFKFRDLQILKTLGNGLDERNYLLYVGRRAELLEIAGRSKELFEKKHKIKEDKS